VERGGEMGNVKSNAGGGYGSAAVGQKDGQEGVEETVVRVLSEGPPELFESWLEGLRSFEGGDSSSSSRPAPIGANELRERGKELLPAFARLFASVSADEESPDGAEASAALRREVSAGLIEQGLTAGELAAVVFSLKYAVLETVRSEATTGRGLDAECMRVSKVIDEFAYSLFESISRMREEVIALQQRSLLELSTPVIQLWDEIELMPLIGMIDTGRAQQMIERLLNSIVETQSRVVVLDVTGVPIIDTDVARHLFKTVAAARMLGAEVIVTGIRPEAAQTLVRLGIDLETLRTSGTLWSGVARAFRLIGKQVAPLDEGGQ